MKRSRRLDAHTLRRIVSPLTLVSVWQLCSTVGLLLADKSCTIGDFRGLVDVNRIGQFARPCYRFADSVSRTGDEAVDPLMQMFRTLPHLGMTPLLICGSALASCPRSRFGESNILQVQDAFALARKSAGMSSRLAGIAYDSVATNLLAINVSNTMLGYYLYQKNASGFCK